MTESIRQIAVRIREVRENSGLSPDDVAVELKISPEIYRQYEAAERPSAHFMRWPGFSMWISPNCSPVPPPNCTVFVW